jgi:glycogen(starch) synthase
MKIALLSYTFPPAIGGIETVSYILAGDLAERGHEVTVLTHTRSDEPERDYAYRIIRRPTCNQLNQSIFRAHVVLQNNISLHLAWPLYVWFLNKPYILVHHTPVACPDGRVTARQKLKRVAARRAKCFSVSKYIANTFQPASGVLPNPYSSTVFVRRQDSARTNDLLFAGRLAYAKGVDTLLYALAVLRDRTGLQPNLTIVGSGPEETSLKTLAASLRLERQTQFVGPRAPDELAELMNTHSVFVVPSRPNPPEAFGIVAVEAIACGCVVVASNCGGLPEAVGACGTLFECENPADLAMCLLQTLSDEGLRQRLASQTCNHLRQFDRIRVVDTYERLLSAAISAPRPREKTNL